MNVFSLGFEEFYFMLPLYSENFYIYGRTYLMLLCFYNICSTFELLKSYLAGAICFS